MPKPKPAGKEHPAGIEHPIDKQEGRVEYFIAQTQLTNDATERQYEAGETVTSRDFEPGVIDNWLKIGVLVRKEDA
ncbi:MAG: hypothetical protein C4575_12935 [Desulforudis sp.]|nr:MAG: hypothetical protein C4575_12935 [Desulforudis sp.]